MASLTTPLVDKQLLVDLPDLDEGQVEVLREGFVGEALRLQRIFNLFDPASELSLLNKDRERKVSAELRDVLATALAYAELTDGIYDVTHGKAFLARKQGKPLPALGCAYKDVRLSQDTAKLAHPDCLIDLGSIAKGAIGDLLAAWLQAQGVERGYLDLRGDVLAFGGEETVAIQHPRDPAANLGTFALEDAGAATSGDYKQYWGSTDTNHIVGARDYASVTIIHPSLMHADAIATCVALLGSARAAAFLRQPACRAARAVLVTKDLTIENHGVALQGAARAPILEKELRR